MKKHLGLTLILTAAMALPVLAQSDFEREMKDRHEIEKLMWQYARALDTENADAYVATYTPDGQFGVGPNATKGREALHKMISDLRKRTVENEAKGQKRPPMYHANMNHYLEFVDKDHAILRSYYITAVAGEGQATPPRIAAAGWERNELVRLNGKWLIKVRDTQPKGE